MRKTELTWNIMFLLAHMTEDELEEIKQYAEIVWEARG